MKIQAIYHDGSFTVDDDEQAKALRGLLRYGQPVELEIRVGTDNQLRRRWFKLLKFAFDYYEPSPLPNGIVPIPNFNRYRSELTIMAGYYTQRFLPDGSVVVEAQSTATDKMSAEDFADLYRKTNQILIDRILAAKGFTQQAVDAAVEQLLRF